MGTGHLGGEGGPPGSAYLHRHLPPGRRRSQRWAFAPPSEGEGGEMRRLALVAGKDPSYVRTSLRCQVTARSALSLCFGIGPRG